MPDSARSAQLFAQALIRLEQELDWILLGRLYCHEGGEHFFPPEQIEAQREAGLRFASDLGGAYGALRLTRRPRSLYVGVGLFELYPMLFEALVLGHSVRAFTLASKEVRELNRVLEHVGKELEQPLPRILVQEGEVRPRGLEGPFDHIWMTSVLTDPDRFPALHARLYGRPGGRRAARRKADQRDADELLGWCLERARPRCLWTTTDEELELLRPLCSERRVQLMVPDRARLSGIVGDPVRVCRLGG